MKDITLDDLTSQGVSLKDAQMALEAYYSSRIEGAKPITAKRLIELLGIKQKG